MTRTETLNCLFDGNPNGCDHDALSSRERLEAMEQEAIRIASAIKAKGNLLKNLGYSDEKILNILKSLDAIQKGELTPAKNYLQLNTNNNQLLLRGSFIPLSAGHLLQIDQFDDLALSLEQRILRAIENTGMSEFADGEDAIFECVDYEGNPSQDLVKQAYLASKGSEFANYIEMKKSTAFDRLDVYWADRKHESIALTDHGKKVRGQVYMTIYRLLTLHTPNGEEVKTMFRMPNIQIIKPRRGRGVFVGKFDFFPTLLPRAI